MVKVLSTWCLFMLDRRQNHETVKLVILKFFLFIFVQDDIAKLFCIKNNRDNFWLDRELIKSTIY